METRKPIRSKTEERLKNSFDKLIQTHPLEKVTVKMICEESGCDRSAFYMYFDGIGGLLKEKINDIYSAYISRVAVVDDLRQRKILSLDVVSEYRGFFTEYFKYSANRELISLPVFEKATYEYQKVNYADRMTPTRFEFIKSGVKEILRQWLASGCERPTDELADELIDIVNSIMLPKPEGNADHGDGSGS